MSSASVEADAPPDEAIAARPAEKPVELRAPTALVVLSGLLCLGLAVLILLGAWRVGITTDETYHVQRLQHFFGEGWYLLDDDLAAGRPGSWVHDTYVYAPATALLMHAVNVVLGNEHAGSPTYDLAAFQVRHLVVACLGLLGAWFVAAATRRITGSWGWGVLGAALLLVTPLWAGQSMFNVKDVPVATGYTAFTYGLLLVMAPAERGTPLRWRPLAAIVFGGTIAVGTRPGIWPGLFLAVVAALVLATVVRDLSVSRRQRYLEIGLGCCLAAAAFALIYPVALGQPLETLRQAAASSADYGPTRSRWYVPVQVVYTFPSVLLLLVLVAAWGRARAGSFPRTVTWRGAMVTLVVLQATTLPVAAVLRESYLYNGLRQLLFVLPAVSVLATLALRHAVGVRPAETPSQTNVRRVFTGVLVVGLALPTATQLQLFPYSYAYASGGSTLLGAQPQDYWRASLRELVPSLPADEFVVCMPALVDGTFRRYNAEAGRSPAEMSRDCRADEIGPIRPLRPWPGDPTAATSTFVALAPGYLGVAPNCDVLEVVERRQLWASFVIGRSMRCQLVLEPYVAPGLRFDADGTGSPFLLGGWTANLSRPGVELLEPTGSVGFTLPDDLTGVDLLLEMTVAGGTGAIMVNDVSVPVSRSGPDTLRAIVPADVAGALGDGRVVVTIEASADSPRTALSALRIGPSPDNRR